MSYTALYRKWRPSTFEDVRGQEHIVQTLTNQMKAGRIGHAYLFCGTRGTGKTSIAKIFAKAVNCEHPVNGSPCNQCAICKAISAGNSMNVVEIDAASNNGVDNIREIRDEVQYSPTEGNYRVYIIDEVHMLSSGAFNALLKTLEEPPAYVIFILATTEVHKIPVTVLSRCQRYDFKRISVDTISAYLKELTAAEHIKAEEKALTFVAKTADGSLRDALSLLDQCVAFYFGETLTYDHTLDVLGAVDTSVFSGLLRNVLENQAIKCISKLEEIVMQGRDLTQFVIDFTWYLRNLLLLKNAETAQEMIDMSAENLMLLREESQMTDSETLMRFIRIFSDLSNQMRYASQKRILVEIAFIKLSTPQMEENLDSVLQRLNQLEKQMEEGIVIAKEQEALQRKSAETIMTEADTPKQVILPKAQLEDMVLIRSEWSKIIKEVGMAVRPSFKDTIIEPAGEGRLSIVFFDSGSYAIGNRAAILQQLREYVAKIYHKEIEFTTRLKGNGEVLNTRYVSDEDLKVIHSDIIIED